MAFLEEAFSSPLAVPRHRLRQKAAQAVLRALLPEKSTNIKGRMRAEEELRLASGYADRPLEFADLIHILDNELRLITPAEAEGVARGEWRVEGTETVEVGSSSLQPGFFDSRSDQGTRITDENLTTSLLATLHPPLATRYYQLTHDYLVHSLRDWLTRKQRETRRGRAELLLAERAAFWNAKPEHRHLPSLGEWASIRYLTCPADWTESQRRMMRRSGRLHGLRLVGAATAAALAATLGLNAWNRRAQDASSRVQQILKADIAEVPELVRAIDDYRRWTDPEFRRVVANPWLQPKAKLRASLALLPVDPTQFDYLESRVLDAVPAEVLVLRERLRPRSAALIPKLWALLESSQPSETCVLPSAACLALYDPESGRWSGLGGKIAQAIVQVSAIDLRTWLEALRPIRGKLAEHLAAIFRDKDRSASEHSRATEILTVYARGDPKLIADLLTEADPGAYPAFFALTDDHKDAIPSYLKRVIRGMDPNTKTEVETEDIKDDRAKRQANAAITLLRMGHHSEVMKLLRHLPDPRLRSLIINSLKPLGVEPDTVAREFKRTSPVATRWRIQVKGSWIPYFLSATSIRRALILGLGTYESGILAGAMLDALIADLLEIYKNDPDAGIHGAAEWTLRQWNQQAKLSAADAELSKLKSRGDRRWLVNSQGQTFAVIAGPVEFVMGSPQTDPDRHDDETPHHQVIPRRFAIAAKEVSVQPVSETDAR